jgi:dephospho-CoA kinase
MLIGITGGIASGKTMVSKCLESMGCMVIDADQINRKLSAPCGPIWAKIKERFGDEVLLADGRIDKSKLGQMVFHHPEKRKILEEISHPLIIQEENNRIERIKNEFPAKVIVLEASLLIEAGQHHRVDKLIVVAAEKERRIEWLSKERGMNRAEAEKRMAAQMPCQEKEKLADYVIRNDGTREDLIEKTRILFHEIMKSSLRLAE